jgi:UDP-3-O-[3-hydroxymyristoyl] glucosamine N-acyltransferase
VPTLSASAIAALVGGELAGPPDLVLDGVAGLEEAGPSQVSFLSQPKYRKLLDDCAAGLVLVPRDLSGEPPAGRAWVRCAHPSRALSQVLLVLQPPPARPPPGIHPSAVIAPDAVVPASATVGPLVVLAAGVRLGERCQIGAGCLIGQETVLGDDCYLHPGVIIRERCRLGQRVIVHAGAVIGSDGFGFEPNPRGHEKIPQLGIVQLDDDVSVGANTTIDRARFGRTWIQRGVKIDNQVQIAHNVVIGEHSFIVAQVGIAGSSRLGRLVTVAGQAGMAGHLTIGDGAVLMGGSGAFSDVAAGAKLLGYPAIPQLQFLRQQVALGKLPDLIDRVRALEAELSALKAAQDQQP